MVDDGLPPLAPAPTASRWPWNDTRAGNRVSMSGNSCHSVGLKLFCEAWAQDMAFDIRVGMKICFVNGISSAET